VAARRLLILVTAAEDLAEGVRHEGPRAFSQAHFGDTKRADDVAQVLREAQVPTWVLLELGVACSPYLGLGGPLLVSAEGATIDVGVFWGPVLLRSDQPGLRVELKAPGVPLLVVENLQAAEAVCDRFPAVAVAYTSGLAGAATLALIGSLASQAGRLILIPDVDLGGVRIAEQWCRWWTERSLLTSADSPTGRRIPSSGTAWRSASCTRTCPARLVLSPVRYLSEVIRLSRSWLRWQRCEPA
jgi:hypothetical protein